MDYNKHNNNINKHIIFFITNTIDIFSPLFTEYDVYFAFIPVSDNASGLYLLLNDQYHLYLYL